MIVTDLDGTLLHTDKKLSDKTVDVLMRCRRQGHLLVYATARPYRAVRSYFDRFLPDAVILHNGAVVLAGDRKLFHCGIEPVLVTQIVATLLQNRPDAQISIEIDDVQYANFDAASVWPGVEYTRSDFADLPTKIAEKILVGTASREEGTALAAGLPAHLYVETSESTVALILHREATKWKGIEVLARNFGRRLQDVIAFGDDTNDLGMVQNAGIGIAMENAVPGVKAVATTICAGNDEDGVARWLEEHVLEGGTKVPPALCRPPAAADP